MTNENQTQNKKEKLEILVVEDKTINQESAKYLLRDHNVSIAGDFVQAIRKLVGVKDGESICNDLSGRTTRFDVVLSDLMFPLGGQYMPCEDTYSEKPLGYSLALIASRLQVPRMAILTDMNHHSGPIAATFDFMYDHRRTRPSFTINETQFMIFDDRDITRAFLLKNGKVSRESTSGFIPLSEVEFPEDIHTDYVRKIMENNSAYPEGYGFMREKESYCSFTGDVDESKVKNWKGALDILLNGYPKESIK